MTLSAVPIAAPAAARAERLVLGLIGLLGLGRLGYAAIVGLAPQETYYWEYARHLDLSYLDHPPMAAWWIALSTALLGESAFAVHLPAVLAGSVLTWLIYRLGARLFAPGAGLLAAVVANATVLFGIGAIIVTPDVPLLVFWTAALLVFVELVLPGGRGGAWRWYAAGALVGLALLSKYTAGLLPIGFLLAALLLPEGRRHLRTVHPWLGAGVALLVFAPVIVWNLDHGMASFAFQTTRRASEVSGLKPHLVGRYLGLQAAAVTPLVYLSLWWAAYHLARRALTRDAVAVVLAAAALPGLALFTAVSPLHWVKMNWVAPAYIGLFVALCGLWWEGRARRGLRRWAGASLATGALLTALMYAMPLTSAIPFPERENLFSGWDALAAHVQEVLDTPGAKQPFVVGWDYKAASELAFLLPGRPSTTSANAFGGNGLMYGMWFEPARHAGRDALVVSDRRRRLRDPEAVLGPRCEAVEPLEALTVYRGTRTVTTFDLWWCRSYRP